MDDADKEGCLERVADGWRWSAIQSRPLTIMLGTMTAFLGLLGALLVVLGVKLAVEPDRSGHVPLMVLLAGVVVAVAVALRSILPRLLAWEEAVFVVDGAHPQVRLRRGRRREVIALADVTRVRVVSTGPADGAVDTYLDIGGAGRRSRWLVGRRGHVPGAAADLRRLLPATIEVSTRID